MAKIQFRAKVRTLHYVDDKYPPYSVIDVPQFKRSHCDMHAFHMHPKYGAYANSDLFPAMLRRIRADRFMKRDYFRLDAVPEGITVDTSGFLATVTFDV